MGGVVGLMETALDLCKVAIPESKSERDKVLLALIHQINDKISDLHLTIRKGVDEEDGQNYFMLVNNSQRTAPLNQCQSALSVPELEYLRLLATEILLTETRSLPSSMALNLIYRMEGGTNAKYSINDAEKTIGR